MECHIYATNVSVGLFIERKAYKIVFLKNNSSVPIITGDQPVINILGSGGNDVEFYYPLSPDIAMILTKDNEKFPTESRAVSLLEVERYNYAIYDGSEDQIYSNSEAYLRELVSIDKNILSTR